MPKPYCVCVCVCICAVYDTVKRFDTVGHDSITMCVCAVYDTIQWVIAALLCVRGLCGQVIF